MFRWSPRQCPMEAAGRPGVRDRVNRLRNKLILIFLIATLVPASIILWMSLALLKHSLSYASTDDLDRLSKSLENVGRAYYQQTCEDLKGDAESGRIEAQRFAPGRFSAGPPSLRQFWESGERDRCAPSEPEGDRVHYMLRRESEALVFTRSLNGVRMTELTRQFRRAREQVEALRRQDLQKGFTYTLMLISALIWILSLAGVVYLANRISRPVQELTSGLHRLAGGDFSVRLDSQTDDEIGRAVLAFNNTAVHLEQSRDRLVYLTQIASWQILARKMAHELKNSLTPIRLTVEEVIARASAGATEKSPSGARDFLKQAAQVVIEEVESLERRVRAFSDFAAEPSLKPEPLDLNALLEERIEFLEVAHSNVHYRMESAGRLPPAWADADQVKGILTNLLENAADAAGPGGTVLATTSTHNGRLRIEVHDSGPGLSEDARRSLFEPSISFKKHGMGLGLSISRKNALLAGGDLMSIKGSLKGAGFRLILPAQKTDSSS
jgi:two-component system nitrogen regulation sensor histidine kinase NtrY